MSDNFSDGGQTVVSGGKTSWACVATLGAVCALIIGFYAWSAGSGPLEVSGAGAQDTYYNLLVQGFRAGQLSVKRDVPPGLAQLADPYDPAANGPYRWIDGAPLEELSYYQGKLYLYFGITPALVLFWPYLALTGHYLFHRDAVVIFFSLGFLASVGLLWALWRRYFAEARFWAVVAGALALGLAGLTPVILPRSDVWEVAISCGYALTMLCLLAIWKALQATRRQGWWLAAASLTCGLALGARPSLLFAALILLLPVLAARRAKRRLWPLFLAAISPIALFGIGLMLYNALRFGQPLEFGQSYQLLPNRQDAMDQFSLQYLRANFQVGFLAPARWSGQFPFVHDIAVPPLPRGYNVEHPFGVLSNIPLVLFALAAPLAWRNRSAEARSILRQFLAAVALLFGASALTLGLHNSMCLRYEVEFAAPLLLLAVVGIFGLERALKPKMPWKVERRIQNDTPRQLSAFSLQPSALALARLGWGLLLVFSVAFNWFARFELYSEMDTILGLRALRNGRLPEATAHFQKALEAQPDNFQAHYHCGKAMVLERRLDEALAHFAAAIRLDPAAAAVHYDWGMALGLQGRLDEAMVHYAEALRLQPGYAPAHFNWGNILVLQGKPDEAGAHFEEALRQKPDYVEALNNLGNLLVMQGKTDAAVTQYGKALNLNPDFAQTHYYLAGALARQKKSADAKAHLNLALKLKPDYAAAANDLAWILATETNEAIRHVEEAIRWAERACELTTNQVAGYLDTLGVAYAEAGRFKEAVRAAQAAMALAQRAGQVELASVIRERLELYQAGRLYREKAALGP